MLEFFRTYQRYIFLVVTVMIVSSFFFFGTYGAMADGEERQETVVGHAIDGSAIQLSEVQKLSHFLASDCEDAAQNNRGVMPNLMNDGVIRYDFLRTQLADLIVNSYFDSMRGDFQSRLDKAKRYRPYVHPDAPFVSARLMWERFLPSLNGELESLVQIEEADQTVFSHLSRLYQQQSFFPPELLRRILIYQHQQHPGLNMDQRLSQEDLSLFGFHSLSDWFGHDFVDLISQFILNAAAAAEEKGYRVSLEEAKGDLIRNFQISIEKLAKAKIKPEISFGQHLQMLGFDEKSASELWRKVLLFRRLFQDVGEATFVDRLPFKGFIDYAQETAVVQRYQWPIALRTFNDLMQFQVYLKAVSVPTKDPLALPTEFLPLAQVQKEYPELVRTTFKAKVAEVTKAQVALRPSLKEIWEWQLEEKNWTELKKQFPFLAGETREERFRTLETLEPAKRTQVVGTARGLLVDQNPAWIEEALNAIPLKEVTFAVAGNDHRLPYLENAADGDLQAMADLRMYSEEGKVFSRFEEVAVVEEAHILPFVKAKAPLADLTDRFLEARYPQIEDKQAAGRLAFANVIQAIEKIKPSDGSLDFYAKHRLLAPTQAAYRALQQNPIHPDWVKGEGTPISEQFKLERKELNVQRTSQEEWMKEEAFVLVPNEWSSIQVPADGQITFFYLQERKQQEAPILEQLAFGKETLAADAKRYLAERLLETTQKKQAIVLPIHTQKEIE